MKDSRYKILRNIKECDKFGNETGKTFDYALIEWQNNEINRLININYPHDFSLCDIDGVVRTFYRENNIWKTRLIIFESKREHEKISDTQLTTLYELKLSINWNRFDKSSGVFLFILYDDRIIDVNILENISNTVKPDIRLSCIKKVDINYIYNWFSAKDKRS